MKPHPAPVSPLSLPHVLTWIVLTLLLSILALRLTSAESLRDTLAQKTADVKLQQAPTTRNLVELRDGRKLTGIARQNGDAITLESDDDGTLITLKPIDIAHISHQPVEPPQPIPFVGPLFIAAYAALASLLAALMTFFATRLGGGRGGGGILTRFRLGQLALTFLLIALAFISAWHAANQFSALIGAADLLTALAAAWSIALACHDRLLGPRGRQVIFAGLLAILTLGVAKALMQQFIEIPDTAQMVRENPDRELRKIGIDPNNLTQRKLFLARLNSAEVSSFGGMSNVFATQMIADVTLLAALALAGFLFLHRPSSPPSPTAPAERRPTTKGRPNSPAPALARHEVPVHHVALAAIALLLIAGLIVLPLTDSKGGLLSALLALALVLLGGIFWQRVLQFRRLLLSAAAALAILLPLLVLAYGIRHHALPSRSLLFRWQYWTATVPIIQSHPIWGVGLNNFGDYYMQFKSPASPEDVRDPHSFFVRYAAELGLPATLAALALLLCMLKAALGVPSSAGRTLTPAQRTPHNEPPATNNPQLTTNNQPLTTTLLIPAALLALAWIPLHFLTEAVNDYNLIIACLLAVLGWAVFAAAMALQTALTPRGMRYIALAAAAAALAMLLYDQINMALVTGPVAMLFWMLLASADARTTQPTAATGAQPPLDIRPSSFVLASGLALPFAAAALALSACVVIPLSQDAGPRDSAPFEYTYLRESMHGNSQAALAAIDAALDRSPRSIEFLTARIELCRRLLHQPVAADIRRVFQLDVANAASRVTLAIPDTDLPPVERRQALLDALAFDQQLEPQEPKRLTPEQLAKIRFALARLSAYAWFYHP